LFMELDHGAILQKEPDKAAPKIVRFVIGNPLIMKEMAKYAPDAGSYAPVTVLMSGQMACICLMTGWPVSCPHMEIRKLWPSPGTSTQRSKPSCKGLPPDGTRIAFLVKENCYAND